MIADKQRITVDEFEKLLKLPENEERLLELIDGEVIEKMPTEEHGVLILRIGSKLLVFVDKNNLGIVSTDARHRILKDKHNAYLPDISFISFARKQEMVREGAIPLMPDLAIEIKSPDDSPTKLRRKALYYIENGSRLVWLVFPDKRKVEVWNSDGDLTTIGEDAVLEGGDVLPGFQLLIKDIFVV